jgi:hypothetical protein
LEQLSATRRVGGIASHLAGVPIQINMGGVSITISSGEATSVAPAAIAAPVAPTAASVQPAKKELKDYTLAEVAKHSTEKDCWVVV